MGQPRAAYRRGVAGADLVVAEQPDDLVHAAGRVLRPAVLGQPDIGQVPAAPPPGEGEDEFLAALADGDLVPAGAGACTSTATPRDCLLRQIAATCAITDGTRAALPGAGPPEEGTVAIPLGAGSPGTWRIDNRG